MEQVKVNPCRCVKGTLSVPGDKSLSHRAAMLGALGGGASRLSGYLMAEDCLNTLKALQGLGVEVAIEGDLVTVTGGRWRAPSGALDMGNSGTGMRLLAGLLAGRPWTTELTGDESLRSRPMGRIKAPLEQMGARLELTGPKGCAPVKVTGGRLRAIEYAMPVASAQVKSCVLLAALFAEGETSVIEKAPTRDHTEKMFLQAGIPVRVEGNRVSLRGYGAEGPPIGPLNLRVPGDFSSAAFWLAAAGARAGGRVEIEGVGLNPRRTAFLDVLRRMGAEVRVTPDSGAGAFEPAGRIEVEGAVLRGIEVGGDTIANIIDELPLVAVLGAMAAGTTVISGARELRVKESDRIACMAANLRLMGVELDEKDDGLSIRGGRGIRGGARVESYGDHRIAMSAAVLALFAGEPVTIRNTACVATSYPQFWNHLRSIGAEVSIGHCD